MYLQRVKIVLSRNMHIRAKMQKDYDGTVNEIRTRDPIITCRK